VNYNHYLTALQFLTRLPVQPEYHPQALNQSAPFFPWVGLLVGAVGAGVTWACLPLGAALAVLLGVVATVWLTGAFHEDGFADTCDGFGGGWDKANILRIQQDSRLGTYGVIGLGLLLAVKVAALTALWGNTAPWLAVGLMVWAHSSSRATAVSIMALLPYAKPEGKAKPVAEGGVGILGLLWAWLPAALGLGFLLLNSRYYALLCLPLLATAVYLCRLFQRWIGGYTGDGLGAVQQVSETACYVLMVALCRFT
jgi:adenosylcobinamide-GDP ribazoletransferase